MMLAPGVMKFKDSCNRGMLNCIVKYTIDDQ